MMTAAKSPATKSMPAIDTPRQISNVSPPPAPEKIRREKDVAGVAGDKSSKPCAGHLEGQLGAARRDGRVYECKFGKDCIFSHVSIAGKTSEKLLDIAAGLPPAALADIKKAIAARK